MDMIARSRSRSPPSSPHSSTYVAKLLNPTREDKEMFNVQAVEEYAKCRSQPTTMSSMIFWGRYHDTDVDWPELMDAAEGFVTWAKRVTVGTCLSPRGTMEKLQSVDNRYKYMLVLGGHQCWKTRGLYQKFKEAILLVSMTDERPDMPLPLFDNLVHGDGSPFEFCKEGKSTVRFLYVAAEAKANRARAMQMHHDIKLKFDGKFCQEALRQAKWDKHEQELQLACTAGA
jgi:hypothetical protein